MYGIQVMGLWAYWLRQHDFSSASNSFTQIIFLCYKLHYFPITPQTFFKNFCPAINDVISHHCCQFLFFHWLVDFLWNAYILLIFLWCQTSKHTKKTRQPLHSAYKLSWSKTSTTSTTHTIQEFEYDQDSKLVITKKCFKNELNFRNSASLLSYYILHFILEKL